MKTFAVYILASASGVLYVGVTNNIQRRLWEHKQKLVPGFTAKYDVTKLVHYEVFGDVRAAIAREKQIKRWGRAKKVMLIEQKNRKWMDLYAEGSIDDRTSEELF
ncbi:MAG: GIY-YIG nuclease family protein [Candidatus Acidiferrales bacterium]